MLQKELWRPGKANTNNLGSRYHYNGVPMRNVKKEKKQFDSIYLSACVYVCACASLRMNVYYCIGMRTQYEKIVEKREKLRCSKL